VWRIGEAKGRYTLRRAACAGDHKQTGERERDARTGYTMNNITSRMLNIELSVIVRTSIEEERESGRYEACLDRRCGEMRTIRDATGIVRTADDLVNHRIGRYEPCSAVRLGNE
jgi:hypothetical protein